MNNFNINNKDYLLSIKPSFKAIPLIIFITFIIMFISLFYFKTYDVYNTKGYLECNEKCNIMVSINIDDINKINKANFLKINDKVLNYNNINIGNIEVDEINKINIQSVNFEVDQLDNDLLNTFQDIKIYSNYESIIKKIKKIVI